MILYILLGIVIGTFVLEPIVINFLYLSNVELFNDIILSKKSEEKLRRYYNNNEFRKKS